MSILSEIFAGGAESLVKTVGDVVDQCTTTKEEKLQLELELSKSEKAHQLEMAKLGVEEKKMMYAETDSARPRCADSGERQFVGTVQKYRSAPRAWHYAADVYAVHARDFLRKDLWSRFIAIEHQRHYHLYPRCSERDRDADFQLLLRLIAGQRRAAQTKPR